MYVIAKRGCNNRITYAHNVFGGAVPALNELEDTRVLLIVGNFEEEVQGLSLDGIEGGLQGSKESVLVLRVDGDSDVNRNTGHFDCGVVNVLLKDSRLKMEKAID
jgi:hypothetical protein